MHLKIISLLFFFSFSISANISWNLQVTTPDFELAHHKLDSEKFKPYLKKTSWRCWVGPVENKNLKEGGTELRSLRCNYSVEKTGEVTTYVSCSNKRPYGESLIELFDERKNLSFKIFLTCQKNS